MEDSMSLWRSLLRKSRNLQEEEEDLPDSGQRKASFLILLTLLGCLTGLLVVCLTPTIDNKLTGFHIIGLEAWRWWSLLYALAAGAVAVALLMDAIAFCLGRCNSLVRKKLQTTRDMSISDRVEDAHVLHIDDQQQEEAKPISEKDVEAKKLKVLEKVLELGEKVEQVLVASKGITGFVIWVACLLSAWILLFRNGVKLPEHRREILNKVTTGLAGVLLGSAVWMLKTIWLQLLALSFIVERSRERIGKAQENQRLVHDIFWTVLNDFIAKKTQEEEEEAQRSGTMRHLLPSKRVEEQGEEDKVTVLPAELEQIKKKRQWTPRSTIVKIAGTILPVLVGDKDDAGNVERAARVTAKWLFKQMALVYGETHDDDHQHTDEKNECVFIDKKHEQFRQKLEVVTPAVRSYKFSRREVKLIPRISRIRRSELEDWLVKVYVERLILLRTINGRDDILCELNRIVSVLVIVFDVVMFLFVMDLLTTTVAIAIAAQIVALNFMFSDSAKTAFKAFFFVFESRPFDVGDFCKIKNDDDNVYEVVVHDMNFLSTVFKKSDGDKIYYPNSVLVEKEIENLYHVPDTRDVIEFKMKIQGDAETFEDKISQVLVDNIKPYLEKRSKYWYSEFNVAIEKVASIKDTQLVVLTVKHRVNYYDRGEWTKYREQLLLEVEKILREHDYS